MDVSSSIAHQPNLRIYSKSTFDMLFSDLGVIIKHGIEAISNFLSILTDSVTIFVFPALWNKSNSEIEKFSDVFEVKIILMTNIKHNVHVGSKISVRSIP